MPILIISFMSVLYSILIYSQYIKAIKESSYYPFIAVSVAVIGSLLWVYLSRKYGQVETLKYAVIWDATMAVIAFIIPITLFGGQLKPQMIFAMLVIVLGVGLLVSSK